jgi:hypothetical protein
VAFEERRALLVDSRAWIVDGKEASLSTIYYPPSTKKALRTPLSDRIVFSQE